MEVTQFTYFQQMGGFDCKPVAGELTYGLERLAMYIQGVDNVYDLAFTQALSSGAIGQQASSSSGAVGPQDSTGSGAAGRSGVVTYGDVFLENERQMSAWNFEVANTETLFDLFRKAAAECENCLAAGLPIPAYEQAIEASHVFNLLQARGVIGVQERASFMGRVRDLARGACEAYMTSHAEGWAQRFAGWSA